MKKKTEKQTKEIVAIIGLSLIGIIAFWTIVVPIVCVVLIWKIIER